MSECDGFWFVFSRSAAELLGVLSVFAAIGLPIGVVFWFANWQARGK